MWLQQPCTPPQSGSAFHFPFCSTATNLMGKPTAVSLRISHDTVQREQQGHGSGETVFTTPARSELPFQVQEDFCEKSLMDGRPSSVGISLFYFFLLLFLNCIEKEFLFNISTLRV